MTARLAVCLITCDRVDYTRETVTTFADMNRGNEWDRFDLLHFDDASTDTRTVQVANAAGFLQSWVNPRRLGVTATIRRAAQTAQSLGHTHVLILENDWTSARPFPWELYEYFLAVPVAYTLRLTGQYKEWDAETNKGRRPFGVNHAGRGEKPVSWCPLMDAPEPAEMGAIHFGNPPAVTRIETLLWLLNGPTSEKEVRFKCGSLEVGNDYTIRPAFNVFYHIGAHRTPNFKR